MNIRVRNILGIWRGLLTGSVVAKDSTEGFVWGRFLNDKGEVHHWNIISGEWHLWEIVGFPDFHWHLDSAKNLGATVSLRDKEQQLRYLDSFSSERQNLQVAIAFNLQSENEKTKPDTATLKDCWPCFVAFTLNAIQIKVAFSMVWVVLMLKE